MRHRLEVSDQQVMDAVKLWHPNHADAPTDLDLARLQSILSANIGVHNADMLSLTWLRNRFVHLRKKHGLKVGKDFAQKKGGLF